MTKFPNPRPIIGVSLKMYMGLAQTRDWLTALAAILRTEPADNVDLFVIPTYLSLHDAANILRGTGAALGAQNVFWEDRGAYTGEVSPSMLVEAGCQYVEIGHFERRRYFGESEEVVARKTAASVRAGLVPVLCVGEETQGHPRDAVAVCARQVHTATQGLSRDAELVIAYEPIWAVGAAQSAPPEYVRAVAADLRTVLNDYPNARLIYGGSAGPGLLQKLAGTVDGLFLGRFVHQAAAFRGVLSDAAGLVASRNAAQ